MAQHLFKFDFIRLFNELGWDQLRVGLEKEVGGQLYTLQPIAIKRGVQVLRCAPGPDGKMPPYAVRQKIERKVTTDAREHLIIFTDAAQTRQIWQWVARAPGRPTQYREVKWQQGQETELLEQKLKAIAFDLNEEESLTVFGVAERLRGGFDRDNVTKKFYTRFKDQREAFQKFIDGIPGDEHARWYTAVVIDRLMFLWFLQEKYFLNNDKRYLRNRLDAHLAAAPESSFYKSFLCPLFFRGFAQERTKANRDAIAADFGNVPYLNGGLFAEHELERKYGEAIDIPDVAFAALFEFFDQWDWHLDERPLASGKEVNPDVLGYIFEKFVNQKQMGAYYTKEDITEYIAKNTIIPCLFDKVRADHVAVFDAHVWPLLQEDPRRYLYPAMLHGVDKAYPAEIEAGLDTNSPDLLERRKPWNKSAAPSHALPTEIWRETIARHQRTREVLAKLAAGGVRSVADLITYNLNIRQFAQDVIERCADPALIRAFWVALAGRLPRKSSEKFRHGLSVLDPTCGSGAFLFAALQILKPLYQACLTSMSGLLADEAIQGRPLGEKWQDIEEIVDRFHATGTDRQCDYAVLKQIIVNNLYGVDIEAQATEIAKLRLFLKLVALLEPGDEIEPLPDIDFNIRAGNTLVGYASAAETERAVMGAEQQNLFTSAWDDISIRLTVVEQVYNNFQIQQVQRGGHVSAEDKRALSDQLGELEETLNFHLCREYGKDPKKPKEYKAWRESHKPFHWYVDFYPIMSAGGFDVVIGNPPYVEVGEVQNQYRTIGNDLWPTGNLFSVCIWRFTSLLHRDGNLSVIVPISAISTPRMDPLVAFCTDRFQRLWVSSFAVRPAKLFVGVDMNLSIITGHAAKNRIDSQKYTTGYIRWNAEQRDYLFNTMSYAPNLQINRKIGDIVSASIFSKIFNEEKIEQIALKTGMQLDGSLFVHSGGRYFRKCSLEKISNEYKPLRIPKQWQNSAGAALSSSSYYVLWLALSDCYHVTKRDIDYLSTPIQLLNSSDLDELGSKLFIDLTKNSVTRMRKRKDGSSQDETSFKVGLSKNLIDQIDQALARYYNLTEEELDYIVNYDIKYRVGQEVDADD